MEEEEEKRDVTKDKLEDKVWLYVILVEHNPQSQELIKKSVAGNVIQSIQLQLVFYKCNSWLM